MQCTNRQTDRQTDGESDRVLEPHFAHARGEVNKVGLKLGVSRGAKVLRINTDKPSYLPAVRNHVLTGYI